MWATPTTVEEIMDLFVGYLNGKVNALPWSESPLQGESSMLKERLETINSKSILTINSQPALDGALSSDKVFGWGPKNGFVYQVPKVSLTF